ncbi:MAG: hypothetical protein FWD35_00140 [Oscillospiraceae bacterium]|nr:hypothetical protein [Oscillospiraceae bacterium]
MLNKLKRFNRGVILAIIAAIGLTGFIIVDEVTFRTNVPAIQARVTDYYEAFAQMAVSPIADINAQGNNLTEAGQTAFAARYSALINEYVSNASRELTDTYGIGSYRWTRDKDELLSFANDFVQNNDGVITNYDYTVRSIVVRKQGPGLAAIDSEYNLNIDVRIPVSVLREAHEKQLKAYADAEAERELRPLGMEWDRHPGHSFDPNDIDRHFNVPIASGIGWFNVQVRAEWFEKLADDDYLSFRLSSAASLQIDAQKRGGQWHFYGIGGRASNPSSTLIQEERGNV